MKWPDSIPAPAPPLRRWLRRLQFDPTQMDLDLRAVQSGRLGPAANLLSGNLAPLESARLTSLSPPDSRLAREDRELGVEAVARGQVAVAILAGGMATRFGGGAKGAVDILPGQSFLGWKITDAESWAQRLGAHIPVAIITSFATHGALGRHLRSHGWTATRVPQGLSLRLREDGELFRTPEGRYSPHAPGHGDAARALAQSHWLSRARDAGVRWIVVSNVDNVGATLSTEILGTHRRLQRPITVEVVQGNDSGGVPLRVDERAMLVETLRLAPGQAQTLATVSSTNTFVFDLECLAQVPPLTRLFVRKEVENLMAVQIETLIGEWTHVHPTTFLEVDRARRFVPVKNPADLEAARRRLLDGPDR